MSMQVRIPLDQDKYLSCVITAEIDYEILHDKLVNPPAPDVLDPVYLYVDHAQTNWLRQHGTHVSLVSDLEELVLEMPDDLAVEFVLKFY